MFELVDSINDAPVIKLIGVGGGGSNAVQHMVSSGIEGVDFICANTDAQALKSMQAQTVLHIGQSITKGLGAGANPEIGRQAAMEDRDRIQDIIEGTDMLFITAGMGGGTGTGAIPVVAQIAREMGVLTVAVVTKPFPFEGSKRMHMADAGIEELRAHVDSLITIPNEKLLSVLGKNITLLDAFRAANDVLRGAVQGIAELITNPGLINVDFADVRTVMSEMGLAMMGSGIGRGDERATEAAEMAISSPWYSHRRVSRRRAACDRRRHWTPATRSRAVALCTQCRTATRAHRPDMQVLPEASPRVVVRATTASTSRDSRARVRAERSTPQRAVLLAVKAERRVVAMARDVVRDVASLAAVMAVQVVRMSNTSIFRRFCAVKLTKSPVGTV